jgi:cytochrome c peroxidase
MARRNSRTRSSAALNCSTRNTIRITGNTARIVFIATAGRCFKARILRTTDWIRRSDLGRYNVTKRAGDEGKFAVPSLRNVAVTAPYMHDGRFQTLGGSRGTLLHRHETQRDARPESRQASRRRRAVERGGQKSTGRIFENADGRPRLPRKFPSFAASGKRAVTRLSNLMAKARPGGFHSKARNS